MISLEERIDIISKHDCKVEIVESVSFTQENENTLRTLTSLGLTNTPQTKRLEEDKEAADIHNKKVLFNNEVSRLEHLGFKILDKKFVEDFADKLGLHIGRMFQYIKDIPCKNLETIHKELKRFLKETGGMSNICSSYRFYNNKNPFAFGEFCNTQLRIIAPIEHFDETLVASNPDPIAVLDLGKTYLYLDAWDLDGGMFKLGLNLPEVLN